MRYGSWTSSRVRVSIPRVAARFATPTGPAAEIVEKAPQDLAVETIEPLLVHLGDLEQRERRLAMDRPVASHFRVVAHSAQQIVGDPRRAPRAGGDLPARLRLEPRPEHRGGAGQHLLDFRGGIELELVGRVGNGPEAVR